MPLPRVVFIGGLGRSGSTLLERLLGQLPGVCAVGEIVHLWQRGVADGEPCGCGTAFGDCPFWRKVGEIAFGGWDRVDLGRISSLRDAVDRTRFVPRLAAPVQRAAVREMVSEYAGYYRRVYAAAAEASGSRVTVDSSKHASLAFCLRWCADLDLRVIHLVRDSRAVAYSWATAVRRPETPGPSYMTRYAPSRAAGQWNVQNGALELLARSTQPVLRVRYEDMAGAPAATLRQVAGFAGLPSPDRELGFLGRTDGTAWAELGITHTASGNPMRFTTGRVPIRRDDRWRTAMPDAHRRTVTALTLPLLAQYGYAWRDGRARSAA